MVLLVMPVRIVKDFHLSLNFTLFFLHHFHEGNLSCLESSFWTPGSCDILPWYLQGRFTRNRESKLFPRTRNEWQEGRPRLLSSWDYYRGGICHHAWLIFVFLVQAGFCHAGQAGLELLTSGDPPTSASQSAGMTGFEMLILHFGSHTVEIGSSDPLTSVSQVAGTTDVHDHAQVIFYFYLEIGFCYIAHSGLELLGPSDPPTLASQSAGITGHFGRLKQADHLRSGARDHTGQHGETLSLLKIQKFAWHGGVHLSSQLLGRLRQKHFGRLRWVDHLWQEVRDQPGQHDKTLSLLEVQKLVLVVHAYNPSYSGSQSRRMA
ncbi:hypothetical protein AAY473_016078 [Plecturocebus cupreus]